MDKEDEVPDTYVEKIEQRKEPKVRTTVRLGLLGVYQLFVAIITTFCVKPTNCLIVVLWKSNPKRETVFF